MSKKFRPRITEEEYNVVMQFRGLNNVASELDIDPSSLKHAWLKNEKVSAFVTNPEYQAPEFNPDDIDWEYIIGGISLPKAERPKVMMKHGKFDRLVYTDTHIGMDVNNDGYSLYGGKWDDKELEKRMDDMMGMVLSHIGATTLVIDDLGDLMDGWNGKTVRRQHDLPQNMTDQRAFDVALRFKINLVANLAQYYDNIIVNNITDDNHSGAFGYVVNSAFKIAIGMIADNVSVTNHRKFINHYIIGDNVFIISHGKDATNLKFGFTPKINDKQMETIDNYIDEHFLFQPGRRIEFSKGDSHQLLFDWSSSQRFDYFNYMALSPSSNWVQTNYKKGVSGFSFFNYYDTFDYQIYHKFFPWKR